MDYRYLKTFITVAQSQSFSQAARSLHIAQSAVSRQVRLFEESVGSQLLLRTTHYVKLTERGKVLFEKARQFDSWGAQQFGEASITIRIGVLPGLLDSYLTPWLNEFKDDENVSYQVFAEAPRLLSAMLLKNELDACITHDAVTAELIESQRLFSEEIVIVSREDIQLKNLHAYRWIHMGAGTYLKRLTKKEPKRYLEVNSMSALLSFVQAGKGIAAVPLHVIPKKFKLQLAPTPFRSQIYLSYWRYDIFPKPLEDLIKLILATVEKVKAQVKKG